MRWAFDTEFNCSDNKTIDLISIAFVSEEGKEYYAVNQEFDLKNCTEWLHNNVLIHLPKIDSGKLVGEVGGYRQPDIKRYWKPRREIANDIRILLQNTGNIPQLWSYFGSHDFVAFAQLFGGMLNIPSTMPQYTMDLRQLMTQLGIKKSDLPKQNYGLHDALEDARWNMECLKFIDKNYFGK